MLYCLFGLAPCMSFLKALMGGTFKCTVHLANSWFCIKRWEGPRYTICAFICTYKEDGCFSADATCGAQALLGVVVALLRFKTACGKEVLKPD